MTQTAKQAEKPKQTSHIPEPITKAQIEMIQTVIARSGIFSGGNLPKPISFDVVDVGICKEMNFYFSDEIDIRKVKMLAEKLAIILEMEG